MLVFALKSAVIFNEFHQIISQKAIPIINQPTDHHNLQLTTKNIQSTTQYFNRPVLTTLGVLTGGFNWLKLPVKTASSFDRPTLQITHAIQINTNSPNWFLFAAIQTFNCFRQLCEVFLLQTKC